MMRIPLIVFIFMMVSMMVSPNVFGDCYTNERGRTECSNGQQAAGYNANTGEAWKSERNQNGVATTQTSAGGKAKTKNGKGVYSSASGKKCYKTANQHGCT
jgi:hypothetical protein